MPEINLITSSGEQINLSDFQDEVFLLTAMSTACSSCKIQTEYLKELAAANPELKIISVSVDTSIDTPQSLSKYKTENGLSWLVAIDDNHDLQIYFSINSYPQTFIFDTGLQPVKRWVGIAQSADIVNELKQYMDVVNPDSSENPLITSLKQNIFFIVWVVVIISIYPIYLGIKYFSKFRTTKDE